MWANCSMLDWTGRAPGSDFRGADSPRAEPALDFSNPCSAVRSRSNARTVATSTSGSTGSVR